MVVTSQRRSPVLRLGAAPSGFSDGRRSATGASASPRPSRLPTTCQASPRAVRMSGASHDASSIPVGDGLAKTCRRKAASAVSGQVLRPAQAHRVGHLRERFGGERVAEVVQRAPDLGPVAVHRAALEQTARRRRRGPRFDAEAFVEAPACDRAGRWRRPARSGRCASGASGAPRRSDSAKADHAASRRACASRPRTRAIRSRSAAPTSMRYACPSHVTRRPAPSRLRVSRATSASSTARDGGSPATAPTPRRRAPPAAPARACRATPTPAPAPPARRARGAARRDRRRRGASCDRGRRARSASAPSPRGRASRPRPAPGRRRDGPARRGGATSSTPRRSRTRRSCG